MLRWTLVPVGLLCLVGGACGSDRVGEKSTPDLDGSSKSAAESAQASFDGLSYREEWGPCASNDCFRTIDLSNRRLKLADRGQVFATEVTEAEYTAAKGLAMSQGVLDAMRFGAMCSGGTDSRELLRVNVAPTVFVETVVGGCSGPVGELVLGLRSLANLKFGGRVPTNAPPTVPSAPIAEQPSIALGTELSSLTISRTSGPCPSESCSESVTIDVPGRSAVWTSPAGRRSWSNVDDLSQVVANANAPALRAILLAPNGCPGAPDIFETTTLGLDGRTFVYNATIGCSDGPVAQLRQSVTELLAGFKPPVSFGR
jgi:hypothetical protein